MAAEHGGTGLAKTLANELAEYRIRVDTVHPHGVQAGLTVSDLFPMISDAGPTPSALSTGQLSDPVSRADDIAAVVAWLASDGARHGAGIQLPVDPGRTNR